MTDTKVDWMDLSMLVRDTSYSIRKKEKSDIEKNIINTIHTIMLLAEENDIDFNIGWKRWKTKMSHKFYVSDK